MKQILAASLFFLLAGCQTVVPEPVATAEYYVTNHTDYNLKIQLDKANTMLVMPDSIIVPGEDKLIYSVTAMTGGHVLPSNFLTDIRVYAQLASGDSLIYRGIKDADWQQSGPNINGFRLTLAIQ